MRWSQSVSLIWLTVSFAHGAVPAMPPIPPSDAPAAPSSPAPAGSNEKAQAATHAAAVLEDVARAYRSAPVLSDEIIITRTATGQTTTQTINLVLGPGTDARLHVRGHELVASGPDVFIARDGVGDKYFRTELQGNIEATLIRTPGGFGRQPIPHLDLRYGEGDPLDAFNLGMPLRLAVSGYRRGECDGVSVHEISLDSPAAEGTVVIDAQSNLVRAMSMRIAPRRQRATSPTVVEMRFNPRISEELDEPITLATEGRRLVERVDELARFEGESVADSILMTPEGESIRLGDKRGSVIVLYFWTTRCEPCKRGLARMDEVCRWGLATGGNVACYGVLCRSPGTSEQLRTIASERWSESSYIFPVLIDPDDLLADVIGVHDDLRIAVIAPDGTLAAMVADEGPAMNAVLKQKIGVLIGPVPDREGQP